MMASENKNIDTEILQNKEESDVETEKSNNATISSIKAATDVVLPEGNLASKNERQNEERIEEYLKLQTQTEYDADNLSFESCSEDGVCVLTQKISESNNGQQPDVKVEKEQEFVEEYTDCRNIEDSSYTDSPGVFSQEDLPSGTEDDDTDYTDGGADDRISNIEEEYIQRIYGLEQRHYELEDVLARLAACLDEAFNEKHKPETTTEQVEITDDAEKVDEAVAKDDKVPEKKEDGEVTTEAKERSKTFTEKIGLDLFVEFQEKLRNFASDLNGVLNCSEAAIRHARVVQQWATSVQIMFEQIKEERQKILNYIDERERSILIVKEQFIAEFQEQGRQLQHLVDEMNSYTELREKADDYCRKKCKMLTMEEEGTGKVLTSKIVDAVLLKRMEHEQSIMLSLNKQSKISELKLFIIHQQNCIQQLQEQNKELKAIIEGLMGPDDLEEEEEFCETDQSGTPASVGTPDRCPVKEVLNKLDDSPLCLVSDVLHCDRGEYLAGTSTDGDIATIKTYEIGHDTANIDGGDNVVFDPLSISYVREQCRLAEETERQIHEAENIVAEDVITTDEGVKVIQDGIDAINIEPYLRKLAEEEDRLKKSSGYEDASGDGINKTVPAPQIDIDDVKLDVMERKHAEIPSIVVSSTSAENLNNNSEQ